MDITQNHMKFLFLFLLFSLSLPNVSLARRHPNRQTFSTQNDNNPFTPKASLIRYWKNHITNNLPKPNFILSKVSTLSPLNVAFYAKHAANNSLSAHLNTFCSSANLFCPSDDEVSQGSKNKDANFAVYTNKRFSNYGAARVGGVDSFKNYSNELNNPNDSFLKYSRGSKNHKETFTNYADDGNIGNASFSSYGGFNSSGGSGDFTNYLHRVNVPGLRFTTYDSATNTHKRSFSNYGQETNTGAQTFSSYGKKGNVVQNQFTSYAENSNTIDSSFAGYGILGKAANDTFKGYGNAGNNPQNNFKNYGVGGKSASDSFTSYRNGANVGESTFQSYAGSSNSGKANFVDYGKTFNDGNDTFKEYGKGSTGQTTVGFKSYGTGRSFKDYIKKGVSFSGYTNANKSSEKSSNTDGRPTNRFVEPGRFFRESMLTEGNFMVMPDIKDKMPRRSFLPRSILSKIPFSMTNIFELKQIFSVQENSTMEHVIVNALEECERTPSPGETKQCVGSIEDMIDFATSILGHNLVVRSTENVNGSAKNVMIGTVNGINSGRVTKSVSCHQSLFPYLLYYCHSVPKVRVYEAEILDVETKNKINNGVAICHVDTSAWSPTHGAFLALGSSPGEIEVCHWIFENDMTWNIAD